MLPVSAAHSGLAEVSEVLASAVPAEAAPWLSFPLGEDAVAGLAGGLEIDTEAADAAADQLIEIGVGGLGVDDRNATRV